MRSNSRNFKPNASLKTVFQLQLSCCVGLLCYVLLLGLTMFLIILIILLAFSFSVFVIKTIEFRLVSCCLLYLIKLERNTSCRLPTAFM